MTVWLTIHMWRPRRDTSPSMWNGHSQSLAYYRTQPCPLPPYGLVRDRRWSSATRVKDAACAQGALKNAITDGMSALHNCSPHRMVALAILMRVARRACNAVRAQFPPAEIGWFFLNT
jgi:hypothetical protein